MDPRVFQRILNISKFYNASGFAGSWNFWGFCGVFVGFLWGFCGVFVGFLWGFCGIFVGFLGCW